MNREMRKVIESAFYNYKKYEDMKSAKEGVGMGHVFDAKIVCAEVDNVLKEYKE